MSDHCGFCGTPYSGDLDENGLPFCECSGAQADRLEKELGLIQAQATLIGKVEERDRALGLIERLKKGFSRNSRERQVLDMLTKMIESGEQPEQKRLI